MGTCQPSEADQLIAMRAQVSDNTIGCNQMHYWKAHILLRMLLISCFLSICPAALNVLAQTPAGADAIAPTKGITVPAYQPFPIWPAPKTDSRPTFLKNLKIESFGYSLAPQAPGFQFSPGYAASFFNLNGLECPGCVGAPILLRPRFTLPPFGAKAILKLQDDRVELFGGFAGLEAWKHDGTFEPQGHSLFSSSCGDAWLVQSEAGARIALDRSQHVWLGASGRHLSNFGPGLRDWNTFSGSATFEIGHH
jgi:hypothetical protein